MVDSILGPTYEVLEMVRQKEFSTPEQLKDTITYLNEKGEDAI